jgi:HK97 family phage portal protein
VGLWDFLLHPAGKARGWGDLPSSTVTERKASWTIDDWRAVIVSPLVHGPGATDLLAGVSGSAANSAVFACLQVIATALAEPELKVYRIAAGERVEVDNAPITDLLKRPNPHMTLDTLLWYLSNCLKVDGNAYWRKMRAGNPDTGNVVELWPISPSRLEPRTIRDSGDFISFYRYYVRPGVHEDIPVENIMHFKTGLDDKDHRLGCAPLKRLAREVSSDDQATRYADRLLANLAINGLSLEFDKEAQPMTKAEADEAKARIQSAYGGDNVGAVSVISPGGKLVQHGFSPEQMDLKVLHRVPEERIAAVLGVPAIVAGLGAGLDRSTYSNFSEAREAFTEMTLIPSWRSIAATITLSLLPDFMSEKGAVVDFDIDDVRALGDDEDKKAVRLAAYVAAGILDVNEARAEIGREPRAPSPPADAAAPSLPSSPPEARSRPRILTLPWGRPISDAEELAGLKANTMLWDDLLRKASGDLPRHFGRLKDDLEPDWFSEIEAFLTAQLRRVNAKLRAGADTAEGLVAEGEAVLLGETLTPLQLSLLDDVSRLVVAELGIAFDLDDAASREYLRSAGGNIVGITETTRDAVRSALIEGQQAGDGIPQLAARLEQLPAFNRARAITVSRTELGNSTNLAAIQNYRSSGVVAGVRVFDGDYDAACVAMNGRTFTLEQLPPTLQHPRCLRAFAPITDASELTRSA